MLPRNTATAKSLQDSHQSMSNLVLRTNSMNKLEFQKMNDHEDRTDKKRQQNL